MSLQDYQTIDLNANGAAAADLLSHVEGESILSAIPLSSPAGATGDSPAHFTPAMMSWYGRHVAGTRRSALGDVRASFESEQLPAGGRGFLREAELDAVERRKFEELKMEREAFFQKDVIDLQKEIDRLSLEYQRKRAEQGRDAQLLRPVLYIFVLAVIGLIEGLVNWDAFLKIDWFTPAYATAAFLAVAIGFGTSGHLVGTVLKQWGETFGGFSSNKVKREAMTRFGLGLLLFALGMYLVYYSRDYLIQQAIDRQIQLGEPVGVAVYVSLFGAFVANLLFYGVGVVWAYAQHDRVPEFSEERRRLDKLKARQGKLYRKTLERRQQQKILQARKEADQVERRDAEQRQHLKHYGGHRSKFEQLQKVDARVLALLEDYRSRMVAGTRRNGLNAVFSYDDPARGDVRTLVELDADAFVRERLKLSFL